MAQQRLESGGGFVAGGAYADQSPPPHQGLCGDFVGKTRRIGGNLRAAKVRDTEGIVEIIDHGAGQAGRAFFHQTAVGPVKQHRDYAGGGRHDKPIGVAGRDFHPGVLTAEPDGRNRATLR